MLIIIDSRSLYLSYFMYESAPGVVAERNQNMLAKWVKTLIKIKQNRDQIELIESQNGRYSSDIYQHSHFTFLFIHP